MAEFVQTTLMDGYAGGPHITEAQLGLAHQATFGPDDYVLEGGRESEAQVLTNNSIRIFDAVYCIQGRRDAIPASGYTDVTINNGTQGMNRNDIIVRRYKKDEVSEEESTEYAVIKGTPSSGEAVDPSVTTGDIRSGAILHEMKLYRVKLTGLNIVEVEPLFNILKNQATLQKEIAQSNKDLSDKVAELNGKLITGEFVQLATAGATKTQTVYKDIDSLSNYKAIALYCNYASGYYCNPFICSVEMFRAMSWIVSDRRDNNQNYSAMLHLESDARVKFVTVNADALLYGIR